ncbi:MAG: hypothetical protein WCX74_02725 [Candidatus Paceibacterota bacterium]
MDKKIVIFSLIVILAIIGAVYYFPKSNQSPNPIAENKQTETEKTLVEDNPLIGSIEKTNPFSVDINPIRGYKNPFSKK